EPAIAVFIHRDHVARERPVVVEARLGQGFIPPIGQEQTGVGEAMDIVAPQRQLTTGAGPGVPALRIEQADAVTRNGSAQAAGPQRPLFMAVADDAWGFR